MLCARLMVDKYRQAYTAGSYDRLFAFPVSFETNVMLVELCAADKCIGWYRQTLPL